MGTDSAVVKCTTAWLIVNAFQDMGLRTEMIGTYQTAWMQGTKYGIIMDSLVNDVVAGEIEINTSLAVRSHLVKMDQAGREVPEFSSRYLDFTSKRGVLWYAYTRKISHSGVMGDPTRETIEMDQ